jgi:hypothetical protein
MRLFLSTGFIGLWTIWAGIFLRSSEAAAQLTEGGELVFSSVRLTVEFDPELFALSDGSLQPNQLDTACKVWREAWLKEQGPWGFGLASDVTCRLNSENGGDSYRQLKTYDQWLLSLNKIRVDDHFAIEVKVCRNRRSSSRSSESEPVEKCEAQKIIPWSIYSLRIVRHRAFVRLLSASLLDQMPFLSVVGRNLIHYDKLGIRGLSEPNTPEVVFPPPPKSVYFSEIVFDSSSNRFILKNIHTKEAIEKVSADSGVVWIVGGDGRGTRSEEFNRHLKESMIALNAKFQLDVMAVERERIKSDVAKLKMVSAVKPYAQMQVRTGLPLMSMKSSLSGDLALGLRSGNGLGGTFCFFYAKSTYSLGTDLAEKDSSNQMVTSSVNLAESGFAFYPQVMRPFGEESSFFIEGDFILTSSKGYFVSYANPPQPKLELSAREFSIGVGLGANIPVAGSFEISSSGHFDLGWTSKSTSAQAAAELAWTPDASRAVGAVARTIPLKLGAGVKLTSLGRSFVNADVSRSVETQVTLNGLHLSLFLEKSF